MFRRAERSQSRLRMTLNGPAGSGKTFTALRFATALAQHLNGRIAFIDTEHGSASKYVGETPDGITWEFDAVELRDFSPERYVEAIAAAERNGYAVLVIDSLSHAWEGTGGVLEIKDRQGGSNQWAGWRVVTPIHNRMVEAILQSPCHIIATMRSRMEYVQESEGGRTVIRKLGMAPVQRPSMEYEFDIVCDLDWSHVLTVGKSRCPTVADLKVTKPGPEFMVPVIQWLVSGKSREARTNETGDLLDQLLSKHTAQEIMDANGGRIPATIEEVRAVTVALEKAQTVTTAPAPEEVTA